MPGPRKQDRRTMDAIVVDRRRLAWASLVAFGAAAVVLLVAILPAEYGIDPVGVGAALGFTKLADDGEDAPLPNVTANATTRFTFLGSWPVAAHDAGTREGYTAEGEATDVPFILQRPNVTRVTATLTWTDANETAGQATRPDLFEVTVIGPDGREGAGALGRNGESGGSGDAVAWLDWRTAPYPRSVEAQTEAAARAAFERDVPDDASGVGTWTVRVAMVEAGDADANGVPLAEAGADDGNAWSLTVTVEAFELLVGGGDGERSDSVSFTVPAGEGLEYKFFLNQGDNLTYDWSTDGDALFFDFHGERPDGAPGEFTSHKSGTAAADQGRLVAPFTGTHGWYFENGGTSDVTVRLETRGTYAVVGIK